MIVQLHAGDLRPIYIQIMDEIRRAIVLGRVGADQPLPSTRELARDLRVNPNTVQLAYRELERLGVVYVRRGQGTYVANRDTTDREKQRLVHEVARRALHDAFRNGVSVGQLLDAIRREDDQSHPHENAPHSPQQSDGANP